MPRLSLTDRKEKFDGKTVGVYALDKQSGEIVILCWKVIFRKHNSYAFTAELLDDIDASKIYVVDKGDESVSLFTKNQYQDGPMVKNDRGYQYILDRGEALNTWDTLDEILE